MNGLTPTIIRLPKDDLERYKRVAAKEGVSLSELVRSSLKLVAAPTKKSKKRDPIFDVSKYDKFSTGKKNRDSVEHDKILYGGRWPA